MSRWLVLAALAAGIAAAAYGWLTYGGMVMIDLIVLLSSFAYQLGALPWEIRRNWKAKTVSKMSYGLAFVGAASYTSSTIRALIQPDWIDVASRWWGMVGSLIVTAQIIHYDRVRLSLSPPFISRQVFYVHRTTPDCANCKYKSRGLEISWPIKCDCGGLVHLDRVVRTATGGWPGCHGRCERCGNKSAEGYLEKSPYPLDVTYWAQEEADGIWREISYVEYATAAKSNQPYVAYNEHTYIITSGIDPTGYELSDLLKYTER